jgi:Ca2+-binding RTX toxin-like protein
MRTGNSAISWVTVGLVLGSLLAFPESAWARPTCFGQRATIVGTAGNNRIRGTRRADVILAKGGADRVWPGRGNDRICGGDGTDRLHGTPGSDKVDGGTGADQVAGGAGNDLLAGGPGSVDTVTFRSARRGIRANLASGKASGQGRDTLKSVDRLVGSRFGDTLTGDDNDSGNELVGGLGADTIKAAGGADFVSGGKGNDTLYGGPGFDFLDHQATVASLGGVKVNFQAGTARGHGSDTIAGFEGASGTRFNDNVVGDDQANIFVGIGKGDDTVDAAGGDDWVDGGDGNDGLEGAAGGDILALLNHSAGSTVDLQAGTSTGAKGTDTISSFETVFGSFYSDTVAGTDAADVLLGFIGNETLRGLAGNDTLDGGDGTDTLDGGSNNDSCFNGESNTDCESESSTAASLRKSLQAQLGGGVARLGPRLSQRLLQRPTP